MLPTLLSLPLPSMRRRRAPTELTPASSGRPRASPTPPAPPPRRPLAPSQRNRARAPPIATGVAIPLQQLAHVVARFAVLRRPPTLPAPQAFSG
jgi:hypothetical protein